ncbi:MAG: nucleoside deaminase [Nanoarchaeota archaeon]|jgi:tRNA(Arg) A34 adenosine deaminase TadA|nr:nucleoside deaminase [Nanoarchaeota archaeon]
MNAKKEFMEEAIRIAKESAEEGDYAVGAVIIKDGKILARGKTLLKSCNDPTVHAEIVAIREACEKESQRFLKGAWLYTTHEPCSMCASAAIWAKMQGIVFGATIKDAISHATDTFSWRQIDLKCKEVLEKGNPKLQLVEEFMRDECNELFELSK